jgi:TrmH family RNA methyltransferase
MITSPQNERIKHLVQLQQKSSLRRQEGLFVVEGRRELLHCINADYEVKTIFVDNQKDDALLDIDSKNAEIIEVSPKVYEKIAYRESTEGVVAIVKARKKTLQDFAQKEHPLYVVIEAVEKPGNLGAILRSADAAGVDGVIVCDPLTDLYNPNLIRASIGAIFTVPTVACTSEECIAWLKENKIQILTAQLQDSNLYYDIDMKKATAIVMGTEATGLTQQWRKAADKHIRIPMCGKLDSLNVSVSSAILMFEAIRQRR